MKRIAIVIIDGKEVELSELSEERRKEVVNALNRQSMEALGYKEVKPA